MTILNSKREIAIQYVGDLISYNWLICDINFHFTNNEE